MKIKHVMREESVSDVCMLDLTEENAFKFLLHLLILSQKHILWVKKVVWGGLEVVWGGLEVVWGGLVVVWG